MTEKSYRQYTFSETVDVLCEKKDTVILCHARPDPDARGSAIALKRLLESAGMRAYILCENEMPKRLEFLGCGQDSILMDSLPASFEGARVVSVDTASPSQLGCLAEKYLESVELMIDHHGKGIQYADGYIIPGAAATGELIFDISREMLRRGAVKSIDPITDTAIYAAISSDTGCFRYSSVTPKTHNIAASLVSSGVDAAEVNYKLYDCKPFIQLKAEKLGVENMSFYRGGKIGIIEFPYSLKAKHGIDDEYMETLVDVARSVEGVEIAAVIRQPSERGSFRCSMRSNCDFDVSAVCASLGGGGHIKAAGCTIEASDTGEAKRILLAALGEKI